MCVCARVRVCVCVFDWGRVCMCVCVCVCARACLYASLVLHMSVNTATDNRHKCFLSTD